MDSVFLLKLRAMFAKVEPAFKKQTREYYRKLVQRNWDDWQATLALPYETIKERQRQDRFGGSLPRPPQYVTHENTISYTWEAYQKAEWKAQFDRAQDDADAEVRNAREHFTIKLDQKLRDATKQRKDIPTLIGELRNGVRITGHVKADYPNGDSFRVELSIVRNVRYERGYNPYYQFPARFSVAVIGGNTVKPKSLAWMQENFKAS